MARTKERGRNIGEGGGGELENWRIGGWEDWRFKAGLEDWSAARLDDWRTGGLGIGGLQEDFRRVPGLEDLGSGGAEDGGLVNWTGAN